MLTPTDVHLLVGMLTYLADQNPENIDIELGSMVLDVAAEKERDIDITVTVKELDGTISAYTGIEVKKESHPLDVIAVEQLCNKFNDMPSITHKGIVSASGYSEAAIKKAKYHQIDLFRLAPWREFEFGLKYVTTSTPFIWHLRNIEWQSDPNIHFNPTQNLSESTQQAIDKKLPLTSTPDGVPHIVTLEMLATDLISFALAELVRQGKTESIPDDGTMDVIFPIEIPQRPTIQIGSELIVIEQAIVQGTLVCLAKDLEPDLKVLIKEGEAKPYIACAIAELPNNNLAGITFSDSRQVGFMNIPSNDRLLKKIYRKKLFV